MAARAPHQPVLYQEIIHALQPRSLGRYIDGTIGAGGHARGILEASAPGGELLGLDVDQAALALARESVAAFGARVTLEHASYDRIPGAMMTRGWQAVDGIVLDLGVSSMQLDTQERGFSFQTEAPLDMRFDRESGMTAADIVNSTPESELADLLHEYGQEPRSRKIARLIVEQRPFTTTTQLADIAKRAYRERTRIHPATRTFQALRIAVNDELGCLQRALPLAVEALKSGGRLAVISFHSLEDRIVKQYFREQSKEQVNPPYIKEYEVERKATVRQLNRKPIVPAGTEVQINPRARSARLRTIEKI